MDKEYIVQQSSTNTQDTSQVPVSYKEKADFAESQMFLTPGQMIFRRFMRNKLAIFGCILLAVMFVFCYLCPLIYPYTETELFYLDKQTGQEYRSSDSANIGTAVLNSLEKPSNRHWLGTNKMGQDMVSRLMYGGRISLMVGFVVVFVELVIGIVLGGLAGYYGRWVSAIIMRIVDVISAVPFIPLMLIIGAWLINLKVSPEKRIYFTMIILGFIYWTNVARMVRGNILSLRESEFMQAAKATGIRTSNQIFRHLIPNTMPNLIVLATLDLGSIILLESTMSFLGMGVGMPYASWGNMVSTVNDNDVLRGAPLVWLVPGLCILVTVLAFNFIGDGLRDATDPKMKR